MRSNLLVLDPLTRKQHYLRPSRKALRRTKLSSSLRSGAVKMISTAALPIDHVPPR